MAAGQAPDPAGSRAILVTLHFTTQAGNGLTTIAYAIDDGPWQSVPVGVDGVVDAVTPPVTTGPHTLTYSGRDGTGASQFDATSTFYGSDEPTASTRSRGPAAASG